MALESATLAHINDRWSCGFYGLAYLEPKDVSFTNIEYREGECYSTATGFLAGWNNLKHNYGAWYGIDNGNSTTGCKVMNMHDRVYSGEKTAPYDVGDFNWPIPWEVRYGTETQIQITTANHHATSDAAGTAGMEKAGSGLKTRVPANLDSAPPGWTW